LSPYSPPPSPLPATWTPASPTDHLPPPNEEFGVNPISPLIPPGPSHAGVPRKSFFSDAPEPDGGQPECSGLAVLGPAHPPSFFFLFSRLMSFKELVDARAQAEFLFFTTTSAPPRRRTRGAGPLTELPFESPRLFPTPAPRFCFPPQGGSRLSTLFPRGRPRALARSLVPISPRPSSKEPISQRESPLN